MVHISYTSPKTVGFAAGSTAVGRAVVCWLMPACSQRRASRTTGGPRACCICHSVDGYYQQIIGLCELYQLPDVLPEATVTASTGGLLRRWAGEGGSTAGEGGGTAGVGGGTTGEGGGTAGEGGMARHGSHSVGAAGLSHWEAAVFGRPLPKAEAWLQLISSIGGGGSAPPRQYKYGCIHATNCGRQACQCFGPYILH